DFGERDCLLTRRRGCFTPCRDRCTLRRGGRGDGERDRERGELAASASAHGWVRLLLGRRHTPEQRACRPDHSWRLRFGEYFLTECHRRSGLYMTNRMPTLST